MPYPFLSEPWFDAVKKLADEAGPSPMPASMQLNLVVTGAPDGTKELHIADGSFGTGLIDAAPTKLTIPYEVARNMFINGDQAAAMNAFMSGQIKVEGDMGKLMAMQSQAPAGPEANALQAKLREITADDA